MKKTADIPEIVKRFILHRHLLEPGGMILAAVSGGADSLCLLLVLKELGYPLHIAHYDHGLRPESGRDSEMVRSAAARLGLPFSLGQGDVRRHADKNRLTLEEAARGLRYKFLVRAAKELNASVIVTGHTRNDQAETVLMHLLRGSGLRGLGGIRPSADFPGTQENPAGRNIRLVRPLLCLTHSQTVDYCRQEGWDPVQDPTNQDPAFARNKIRKELIPVLEQYNPSIADGLCRLSDIAQAQNDFIDQTAADLWRQSARELEPGLVRIPHDVFRDAPPAIQQALARRAIREVNGDFDDLAYRHVLRIMEFAQAPTASRRMNLALGVEVSLEYDWLVFRLPARMNPAPAWEGVELPIPGEISIHHPGWKLEIALGNGPGSVDTNAQQDPWTAWVDLDRVCPPLTLRRRKSGDRFVPLGMPGPVRLNDFLASHHLPFSERDRWPLVCDADGILWIPGYRLKGGISPSDRTTRYLQIVVIRSP